MNDQSQITFNGPSHCTYFCRTITPTRLYRHVSDCTNCKYDANTYPEKWISFFSLTANRSSFEISAKSCRRRRAGKRSIKSEQTVGDLKAAQSEITQRRRLSLLLLLLLHCAEKFPCSWQKRLLLSAVKTLTCATGEPLFRRTDSSCELPTPRQRSYKTVLKFGSYRKQALYKTGTSKLYSIQI